MSTIKFGLNCLFFVTLLVFLLVWFICLKLFGEKPKSKPVKPQHPIKTIPKYAKNKIYLSKYYKNPWAKRKKLNNSKNYEKSRK